MRLQVANGDLRIAHRGATMKDSQCCVLDQASWLKQFSGDLLGPVGTLLRALRYDDSPLVLSMWCCLILAKPLLVMLLSVFKAHRRQLATYIAEFYREHGGGPNPVQAWNLAGLT